MLGCWQQRILVVDEPHICEACSHGVGCCLSSAEKDRSGDSEVELELPVPLTCGKFRKRFRKNVRGRVSGITREGSSLSHLQTTQGLDARLLCLFLHSPIVIRTSQRIWRSHATWNIGGSHWTKGETPRAKLAPRCIVCLADCPLPIFWYSRTNLDQFSG